MMHAKLSYLLSLKNTVSDVYILLLLSVANIGCQ